MSFSKRAVLFMSLTILFPCPILMVPLTNSAHGQFGFKTAMARDIDPSGFFVIITREGIDSNGFLGLVGFSDQTTSNQTTSYHFGMRDENGFQYETLDLIRPPMVEELRLSPEQIEVISGIKNMACAELADMISKSQRKFLTDDHADGKTVAEIERIYKQRLQDRFYSALDDIKSTLDTEQVSRLEQIKHHSGIKQVGLAKYLGSSHFNGSISDEDAKALQRVAVQFEKQSNTNALELLKAANKKLLDELTSAQQIQYAAEFEPEFTDAFLATAMFKQGNSTKKKLTIRKTDLNRILKNEIIRTSIGLREEEYCEIKELNHEQRKQLTETLTPTQRRKLNEVVVSADLQRMGTVNSITCGHFREVIKIDDVQAKRLYIAGQKISNELMKQVNSMRKEAFQEATGVLSDSLQESLENMIGDYAIELPEKQ